MITAESFVKAGFLLISASKDYIAEREVYLHQVEFICPCGTLEVVCAYGDEVLWKNSNEMYATLGNSEALSIEHLIQDGFTEAQAKETACILRNM